MIKSRPRIRSIHPEHLTDKRIVSLSHAAYRLWIALIGYADDEGRGIADPEELAIRVPALRNDDIPALLNEIAQKVRGIIFYVVDGEQYYAFRNWPEYQKPKKPYPSLLPPPPVENDFPTSSEPVPHQFGTSSEPVPRERRGEEGRGEEGRGIILSASRNKKLRGSPEANSQPETSAEGQKLQNQLRGITLSVAREAYSRYTGGLKIPDKGRAPRLALQMAQELWSQLSGDTPLAVDGDRDARLAAFREHMTVFWDRYFEDERNCMYVWSDKTLPIFREWLVKRAEAARVSGGKL